ncbi:MAG: ferredoxin [Clostridia bacterium]|jgi:Fe-S-cluster-containing hydrogenase component 2|nr:ferredoxin [Clostridia bacterium]
MKININKHRCPQNHKCPSVEVCPTGAITQKGFACPEIDEAKCIECGNCVRYCPMQVFKPASNF